jgi:hypothetical protein
MRRRDFLTGSAVAVPFAGLARAQNAALSPKRGRISLMTNDFGSMLPATWDRTKELGLQGPYSIETNGGPDPYAPIQKVIDALLGNI